MNSVTTIVQRVWNVYFSRHPDRGSRNENEAQRKGWRGIPPSPHCTQMVNPSLPRVLRQLSSINAGIMCVRISPSASGYGRKAKPTIVIMTSSQKPKRKRYGQMWNDTSVSRRSTNNYLRIGSRRRWLLHFRRSRKTWTKTTLKRQRPYWDAFVQYKSSEDSEQRTAQAKENVMGTGGPKLPSGGGNYRFGGDVTQTIRLLINTIRTPQS